MPPSGEIPSRVEVCVAHVATTQTGEIGLRTAAPFVHKSTTGAGATGIPGVYKHHQNACTLRFVAQEGTQLPKTPIMLLRPLPFANRDPVADPSQVLQDQRGLRVFGILDEAFGKAMVCPSLKAGLPSGHLLQTTLGTLCASRLVGLASSV